MINKLVDPVTDQHKKPHTLALVSAVRSGPVLWG